MAKLQAVVDQASAVHQQAAAQHQQAISILEGQARAAWRQQYPQGWRSGMQSAPVVFTLLPPPEVPKTMWAIDAASPTCQVPGCAKKFGVLNWRHHCRLCGSLICDSCKGLSPLAPDSPACEPCRNMLGMSQSVPAPQGTLQAERAARSSLQDARNRFRAVESQVHAKEEAERKERERLERIRREKEEADRRRREREAKERQERADRERAAQYRRQYGAYHVGQIVECNFHTTGGGRSSLRDWGVICTEGPDKDGEVQVQFDDGGVKQWILVTSDWISRRTEDDRRRALRRREKEVHARQMLEIERARAEERADRRMQRQQDDASRRQREHEERMERERERIRLAQQQQDHRRHQQPALNKK